VSDEFLLSLAGASATLIGAFLVGVIFYLDSDVHRSMSKGVADDSFMRSGARWAFVIFAIPLMVPLTLVGLGAFWGTVVFVGFSALAAASTVDSVNRILMSGIVKSMSPTQSVALMVNQIVSTIAVALLISLPWLLDGWSPQRSAFVPSLLLALAVGFSSTAALVMSIFDLSRGERDASV
jgi:hypothetical protein